jgi:hypothetical protein
MAKARSPQYPVIGLGEAIVRAKAVYGKDYQNRIPRLVVAKHMGFKALHGKSLGVLATLSRYGLLEGRGAEYRITDRAVAIFAHPAGSAERNAEIQAAAAAPPIFQELDKRFPNGKGSDEGIRAYLLTNHFIPDAADTTIRSYRETKKVVVAEANGYDSTSEEGAFEAETEAAIDRSAAAERAKRKSIPLRDRPPPPVLPPKGKDLGLMDGERELTAGLLAKGTNFRLIVSGHVGVKEIEMLIKKLHLDKEILGGEEQLGEDIKDE